MSQSAEDGLMTLLEAMLTLAAREARRPKPPPVKPGGYCEDQFLDLSEDEKEEFSCQICYQIIKETMQCVNNHKFCHSCLLVWSTTGQYANRIKCPVCRTHGYYFRDSDLDDRIGNKKVKCHLDTCTWSGKCKQLLSHKHTTYGDDKPDSGDSTVLPRLSQASPSVPPVGGSRFTGTGLTTRDSNEFGGTRYPGSGLSIRDISESSGSNGSRFVGSGLLNRETTETNLTPLTGLQNSGRNSSDSQHNAPQGLTSLSRSRASPSSLSTSQETVVELPQTSSTRVLSSNSGPRRVPPVRAPINNRIVFNHSRPTPRDGNNNLRSEQEDASPSESTETVSSSITSGFTPRPPSAPRTNTINVRRLPRITNPPPLRRYQPPEALALGIQTNSNHENTTQRPPAISDNLGEIRDRLQESRHRLDNLMTSFTGELDRNRQEMADFQQERERQRREQLDEVRELGQRLGQVASGLRRLLEHRRGVGAPPLSDSDEEGI